jgi:kumamolisin
VSANANFTYYVCANQTACAANQLGGTSFAAPLWAGYLALVNQQAAADGKSPVGFINPIIYAQNVTASYGADFHDIASGTSGSYSAAPGYDLVTGWGSPNGSGLISALTGTTTTTAAGFTLSVPAPPEVLTLGRSSSITVTISVSGGFSAPIALSAAGEPTGVKVSFSPSSLTGAGSSKMTLSVSRSVTTATYPITITAVGGGIVHSVTVDFTVRR